MLSVAQKILPGKRQLEKENFTRLSWKGRKIRINSELANNE